jgi:hypothetical protein|tara:strand:- start:121 stop:306 length:186 start_codon:yes stop_codon:yes gene_type:complete
MIKVTITAEVPTQHDVDRLMNGYNGLDVEGLFPNGSDFSYAGEPEPDPAEASARSGFFDNA